MSRGLGCRQQWTLALCEGSAVLLQHILYNEPTVQYIVAVLDLESVRRVATKCLKHKRRFAILECVVFEHFIHSCANNSICLAVVPHLSPAPLYPSNQGFEGQPF